MNYATYQLFICYLCIKVLPYLIVLGSALTGMNVAKVLILGILSTGLIGLISTGFDIFGWFGAMGDGISGMGELIIITLMAAIRSAQVISPELKGKKQ